MTSSSEDETVLVAITAAAAVFVDDEPKRKKRKKRAVWAKPWLLERSVFGVYESLLQKMKLDDVEGYQNYLRMSEENFLELVALVRPDIEKQNTWMREAIPTEVKLAATIRFLATGRTYTDSQYEF